MNKSLFLMLLGLLVFLSGCQSGFKSSYDGLSAQDILSLPNAQPCDNPTLKPLPYKPVATIINDLYEDGYSVIGTSFFTGGPGEGPDDALKQAKELGACLVLYGKDFSHTVSGTRREDTPTVETHQHSGSVYDGTKYIPYSGTTTTYGTKTKYIPYSYDWYNYVAMYAVKQKETSLGIRFTDLPESVKKEHNTSYGGLVLAVRKGSSAYRSGILKGDVVLAINGKPMSSETLVEQEKHLLLSLDIIRNGQALKKIVHMLQ